MRLLVIVAVILSAVQAFSPARTMGAKRMEMSMDVRKFIGAAGLAFSLAAPVLADGATSISNEFRARNSYGARIVDLGKAVESGNFAAFEDKKIVNGFDLFISTSNSRKNTLTKERKAAEKKIEIDIYAAVKAKDAGKLKAAYKQFIDVADLKSDYKPGELGQTDSSGYAPTWGTDRQYIYQR